MHDFDEHRHAKLNEDRRFKIGGEVFTHRPGIRPERMIAWESINAETSAVEALEITDGLIIAWLDTDADPSQEERYRKLREREEDPLSGGDLNSVIMWLYRQSTRRPTGAPTSSSDGRGSTGTESTATSSTAPAEESAS